jgi:hypothetical protein
MLLMLHDMNLVQKPFFALWIEQMSGRLSVAPVLSIGPIGGVGGGEEFDDPNFPYPGFFSFFSGDIYIYIYIYIF